MTTWQKDVVEFTTPPRAAASSGTISAAAMHDKGMAGLAEVPPPHKGMAELAEVPLPQYDDIPLPPGALRWPGQGEHVVGVLEC